jgi:hypothetical protein
MSITQQNDGAVVKITRDGETSIIHTKGLSVQKILEEVTLLDKKYKIVYHINI